MPAGVAHDALDAWLACDLQPSRLAAKPFSPLPVLGVPGWWPENADPAFYDDGAVFRPARSTARSLQKPYPETEIVRGA